MGAFKKKKFKYRKINLLFKNNKLINQDKKSSKNIFTINEDKKLIELHSIYKDDWQKISESMPNRSLRQCKERYIHYLSPKIKSSPWTEKEDELLFQKVQELGKKWKVLEHHFPGRTEIGIRNRWNMMERKYKRDLRIQEKNQILYQKDILKNIHILKNTSCNLIDNEKTSNAVKTNDDNMISSKNQQEPVFTALPNPFNDDTNTSNDNSNSKSFKKDFQSEMLQNDFSLDKIFDVDFNFENDMPTNFFL